MLNGSFCAHVQPVGYNRKNKSANILICIQYLGVLFIAELPHELVLLLLFNQISIDHIKVSPKPFFLTKMLIVFVFELLDIFENFF